jgi:hypothetical protein
MSYCRWSSDDYRCDVYVYEDSAGGWTTHVARVRVLGTVPPAPRLDDPDFVRKAPIALRAQHEYVMNAIRQPIGLPHDGKRFNDPSPGECAARLQRLKDMGYLVPDYAIEALMKEQELAA